MVTRSTVAVLTALLAGSGAQMVHAAGSFKPFATVGVEHNSNLFMLPGSFAPFAVRGIHSLTDTVTDYSAGFTSRWGTHTEYLSLDAAGVRYDYNRFGYLNHYEYHFAGDWGWRLGPVMSGEVMYHQSRVMAPFTNTLSLDLLLNTDRLAAATVRILVSPKWRISLTPEFHQLLTPLPGFLAFKLEENIGTADLDYLGFGKLTAGLQFIYDRGRFADIAGATRYIQREVNLTASYHVSDLSTFRASAGYSMRDTAPNIIDAVQTPTGGAGVYAAYAGVVGKTSSAIGTLSYQRQLTGKTSASIAFSRAVESYSAGANPVIATGGQLKVTWKPDVKFTVNVGYSLTRDQIQGGLVVADVIGEDQRKQVADLDVRYAALSWLSIRPYFRWSRATSTFILGNYSQTIVGIDVTGRMP